MRAETVTAPPRALIDKTLTIKKHWAETFIYLALIAVNAFYFFEAYRIHSQDSSPNVGPGGFPLIIACANVLLLLALLFISLFLKPKRALSENVELSRPISVLSAIAILTLEATLLTTLGPLVAIAFFSFLLMWVAGERRLKMLVVIPPILSAAIYAIFVMALGVYFD